MDFVTITDHDTIEGCLAISSLSDTFISEQVTTYFPHDTCKINLLVWGHSEAQHTEICRLRDNIFDLQAFLQQQALAHAVAHPLYSINGKLDHIASGAPDSTFPAFRRRQRPARRPAWRPHAASAYTADARKNCRICRAPPARSRPIPSRGKKSLSAVRTITAESSSASFHGDASREHTRRFSRTRPCRQLQRAWRRGTPLALSHGFYNTLSRFIQDRFTEKLGPSAGLVEKMFSRFMEGLDPTRFTLGEKAGFIAQGVLSGKIFEFAKPANISLWHELSGHFAQPEVKARLAREVAEVAEPERRTFIMANAACEQLAFRLFERFVQQIRAGKVSRAYRRWPVSHLSSLSSRLTSTPSQPGAVAALATRDMSRLHRRDSARPAKQKARLVHRYP